MLSFEAMGKVSKMLVGVKTNMFIEFESWPSGVKDSFKVNESNANELQEKMLNTSPTEIRMSAMGEGIAFVEISCGYSIKKMPNLVENYELMVGSELAFNGKSIEIHISARALAENANADVFEMTVIEIELPSGFEFKKKEMNNFFYKEFYKSGVKVSVCW